MAWLAAKCPVSAEARVWIEDSLQWLRREFGDAALKGDVLPPESFFPSGTYAGTEADLDGWTFGVSPGLDANPPRSLHMPTAATTTG